MKTRNKRRKISKNAVAIQYLNAVILPDHGGECHGELAISLQAELMRLGYMLDEVAFERLSSLTIDQISIFFREYVPLLWEAKGADKSWRMFYKNFPRQVMSASDADLYMNAMMHYWSCGDWVPVQEVRRRVPAFEVCKFIELKLVGGDDILALFSQILGASASISEMDKQVLVWFVKEYGDVLGEYMPDVIPFKENLCFFAALHLNHGLSFEMNVFSSATDVLRLMVALSGGDVSLAENTKLRSWKRSERRYLIRLLERVIREDDVARHGEKWKRAFHGLHIGDYANMAPRAYAVADMLRNGNIVTQASLIEAAIAGRDAELIFDLLGNRPGELARRLDHLMRVLKPAESEVLLDLFEALACRLDVRVLVQLYGHFKHRNEEMRDRLVLPKGGAGKACLLKGSLPALMGHHVARIVSVIWGALGEKFSDRGEMGSVWIDPKLKGCPLALGQRSASESLKVVARGTRLALGGKRTLRMFIWWVGQDVDLSCVLYDKAFKKVGHLSYTNLRLGKIRACHSGDIVRAPEGAAEFIDIDMDDARRAGVRYIAMNVLDFTGKTFAEYEECFAGWMMRDYPDANEVYDARTVEQKVDLRSATTLALPVIFDVEEGEAIWADLAAGKMARASNNVENRSATIVDLMRGVISLRGKMSLYELFLLHAQARGELVNSREEADCVFSMEEGTTPFDISEINSGYL